LLMTGVVKEGRGAQKGWGRQGKAKGRAMMEQKAGMSQDIFDWGKIWGGETAPESKKNRFWKRRRTFRGEDKYKTSFALGSRGTNIEKKTTTKVRGKADEGGGFDGY